MSSLLELLSIYKWTLPSSIAMSLALALIGSQWTAREKSTQIFVLGQGTSLGIVLGLALNVLLDSDHHIYSLILGFSLGWVILLLTEIFFDKKANRNHAYLTLFVLFLSLTYLVTSLVPSLESHMASAYFGDLAVMSDLGAKACLGAAIVAVVWFLKAWKKLTLSSFQIVNQSLIHKSGSERLFDLATLLLTALAVQSMGYLFTLGSLFIGTSFAATRSKNLQHYLGMLILISVVGTLSGFLVSLTSTILPTVPSVLLGQITVGVLVLLFYRKK
ncbi:metal ABC transporter permease [Bdellovibrio sp. HCB2-146]|uniref:metal ABC transporter permease n=1 Tax=Bdellovibrio sp. HCB2-146 TaxID=3394362 RepID=UPI0039BC68DB